ncbi:hypothetical protein CVT26_006793, partial [Gymnopilus dilepis]
PCKLVITLANLKEWKPLPESENLVFGETQTDHVTLVIRPNGVWLPKHIEDMKPYIGHNGEARLLRPERNMARLARLRNALPYLKWPSLSIAMPFQSLIDIGARWIPNKAGYSPYIRLTIVDTRPECVRAWPGGTGGHKLSLNYAPGFLPQRLATKQGYSQLLWLLGDDERITEVGVTNFFVTVQTGNGEVDLITPPLDGTNLPGKTRQSTLPSQMRTPRANFSCQVFHEPRKSHPRAPFHHA